MNITERLHELEAERSATVAKIEELKARAKELNDQLNEEHATLVRSVHRIEGALTILREQGAVPSAPATREETIQ